MTRGRLLAVVGPTATGKSAIAVELAQRFGGEIVNADSRQVYRGMDIATAKPTGQERRAVPHHLYGVAAPREPFSLALYLDLARSALEACWARDALPWLVGGTGQYTWALLEGWTVPAVPPDDELRARLGAIARTEGEVALHERLRKVDPVAAERIEPANVRRVIRALEVYQHTGRPISEWQEKRDPGFDFVVLGVDLPDEELQRRIEARVAAMFEGGLVLEVERLLDGGLPADAPALSAIGYREVVRHLQGETDLVTAMEETVVATRRLVRRQRQWFRKDDSRIRWGSSAADLATHVEAFLGASDGGA